MVEQSAHNALVSGSIPAASTNTTPTSQRRGEAKGPPMTPHSRAHLLRRIASKDTVAELRNWWEQNAGHEAKNDAVIVAAKDERKATLK